MTEIELQDQLRDALGRLKQLIATFDVGRVIREGVETAIVGRPNVGKSTLMNLLAGCQKSIVTNVPGTTRDIVEETVNLDGALLRLADTAGLRETEDLVESFGVEKARKKLESAGLVLAVFDSSDDLNKDDLELLELLKGRPAVAVINKTDLPRKIDRLVIESAIPHVAEISAGTGQGAEQIADRIKEVLGLHSLDQNAVLLANERQRDCAVRARQGLEEALAALTARFTFDAVNVCLDEAIGALLELTGQRAGEAVVNQVFARFCVGK